eukprot:COSAG06_NODE_10514_length_1668_cov_1.706820_1_plen_388_part_00
MPLPPHGTASFDGLDSELSERSSGSSSSLDEVVPLPADVLANLRRTLLPGGSRSPWKLRCWASCGTVVGSASGYLGMRNIARALATEDPVDATAWNNLQTETLVVMILAGIFCTECTVILGKAVLQATAPPDGREGVVGSSFYLNRLLKSDVSPEVHQRIAARTRLSALQSLIVVGLAFTMPLRTWLLSSRTEGPRYELDAATKYSYVCVLVCFPPMVIIGTGWLLFLHVPMIIVGDHIGRIAAGVRALSAHSRPINFDALTRSVWHAHDLQQHLSALLAPLLKTFLLLAAVISWHWALIATYPRDGTLASFVFSRAYPRTASIVVCFVFHLSSFFSQSQVEMKFKQTDVFCLPHAHRNPAGGAAPAMAASLRSRCGLYRCVMAVAR